jgi:hypothetical protein
VTSKESEPTKDTQRAGEPAPQLDLDASVVRLAEALKSESRGKTVREWLLAIATSAAVIVAVVAAVLSLLTWRATVDTLSQGARDSQAQDVRTRYEAISAQLLQRDTVLAEHPAYTPYFNDGVALAANADVATQQAVEAIAIQRVDYDNYAYYELEDMNMIPSDRRFHLRKDPDAATTDDNWLSWSESFVGDFQDSPAMCHEVVQSSKAYGADFINAIAQARIDAPGGKTKPLCDGLEGFPK